MSVVHKKDQPDKAKELKEKINELQEKNQSLELDNLTALEALAEVYEMLLTMQA